MEAKVIENIVLDAFKQAKLMLKKVGIYHAICLQHLDTIQNPSHFISERSRKRLLTETITALEPHSSDNEEVEQNNQFELIDTHSHITTTANHENIERTDLKNMKVKDAVTDKQRHQYFEIILGKKCILKSTAIHLLSDTKNKLSS
ncbi:unnamed protein product [Didymodactylos carnosus]|uniref:Uncharacterized protein n=1 Tax=Didymodactylos carnosus TaxID=1234261 RepID=A0A8S2YZ14_9BILA|nr:unnamed protein product [Didymodactylos carnosus]